MSELFDCAFENARTLLNRNLARGGGPLTEADVSEAAQRGVAVARVLLEADGEIDIESLTRELLANYETSIGSSFVISSDDHHEEWYDTARADRKWPFWERYRKYLLKDKRWPESVVDGEGGLDFTTDDIIRLLEDPQRNEVWDRRGLVVGHVQSGKTANYIGLMNKAIDAGYRLVIVLAGMHNSLRSQTQIRIEEGLTGRDSSSAHKLGSETVAKPVGVGKRQLSRKYVVNSVTSRDDNGDFKRAAAKSVHIEPGQDPLVMVIKKNGAVLKNVIEWIRSIAHNVDADGNKYVAGVPLLIIDDEADQATIDTARKPRNADPDDYNPTIINGRIREMLRLFEQSAYVGYTATPFANVLISDQAETEKHGRDLFPRSFIISLPTPSNYSGPDVIFGIADDPERSEGLPVIREVADYAATLDQAECVGWVPPKHKKDHVPQVDGLRALPDSMKKAVRSFILSCAARHARGQERNHNSMLVHVTRFVDVQHEVYSQVRTEVEEIRRAIRYGKQDSSNPEFKALEEIWRTDFVPTTIALCNGPHKERTKGCRVHQWRSLKQHIKVVTECIKVQEINGKSDDVLDYDVSNDAPKTVIAIGGDKLSRGLTLEGLSVSYFLRASKMYDTLMQMGRWFGYRPGYLDLCRLFTTGELVEWYGHIASASDELRGDFERMCREGRTPADFGHRVRSHSTLLVTSAIKMRDGKKMTVDFSGSRIETLNFYRDKKRHLENWSAARNLVRNAGRNVVAKPAKVGENKFKWTGVSSGSVIEFLEHYRLHPASRSVNLDLLRDYIVKERAAGRLENWSLVLGSGEGPKKKIEGTEVRLVNRKWELKCTGDDRLAERDALIAEGRFRVQGVNDPGTEILHLSPEQRESAEQKQEEAGKGKHKGRSIPSSAAIRAALNPSQGILTLYLIKSQDRDPSDPGLSEFVESGAREKPIVGFVMSLPWVSGGGSKVDYVVNRVYQSELEFDDE
jgi:hypothetical protein